MPTVFSSCAAGIATPGISASLSYFDQFRRENLPANLVQAQRDFLAPTHMSALMARRDGSTPSGPLASLPTRSRPVGTTTELSGATPCQPSEQVHSLKLQSNSVKCRYLQRGSSGVVSLAST